MVPDAQDDPGPPPRPEVTKPEARGADPIGKPPAPHSPRDRIIDALMELAAEREWDDFSINDVAARAGASLGEFRDAFPSKGAVLAGLSKRIDRAVLDMATIPAADEPARERLFDVLMRRLDAMAPYRSGLQSVSEWVRREPLAAVALNGVVTNSMRFMLAAAGIDNEGTRGALKLQGLVIAWGRVLEVWLEDDDPTLARTMAALDKQLARGETWAARIDDLDRLASPLRLFARALSDARRRRRDKTPRAASARAEPLDDEDLGAVV